eukprot:scaffold20068_cov90-Isochrysis_galbana.AAC.1
MMRKAVTTLLSKRCPFRRDGARPPVASRGEARPRAEERGLSRSSDMGQPAAATMASRACFISASRIQYSFFFASHASHMTMRVSRSILAHGPESTRVRVRASTTRHLGSKPRSPASDPSRYDGARPPPGIHCCFRASSSCGDRGG